MENGLEAQGCQWGWDIREGSREPLEDCKRRREHQLGGRGCSWWLCLWEATTTVQGREDEGLRWQGSGEGLAAPEL